jgi:hypothetical protein
MAKFPESVMTKSLKPETSKEVDNSPAIYNARDFNIHHRELLAIEKYLVGRGLNTDDNGLVGIIRQALNVFYSISAEGFIARYSGLVKTGDRIVLPSTLTATVTTGSSSSGDSTIAVADTSKFPSAGYITKFNLVDGSELAVTNQEIIQYAGTDGNVFQSCTRSIDSTTAQNSSAGAVIVSGRCSLMLNPNYWSTTKDTAVQFFVDQAQDLTITCGLKDSADALVTGGVVYVEYELAAVKSFEDLYIA